MNFPIFIYNQHLSSIIISYCILLYLFIYLFVLHYIYIVYNIIIECKYERLMFHVSRN